MIRRSRTGHGRRCVAKLTFSLGALTIAPVGGLMGATAAPAPAGADPLSACTPSTGVIVAVDFVPWGGQIERGCDASPTTGLTALQTAGFTTAGDSHDGPAFVCRIDNFPTPAQDPCINTPPATAYWSYWHADAGQSTWSYSQLGAATYRPLPGSVDAWVFGSTALGGTDGQPSFPPSSVRASAAAGGGVTPTTTAPPVTRAPTTTAPAPPVARSGGGSGTEQASARTGSVAVAPSPGVVTGPGGTSPSTTTPVSSPTTTTARTPSPSPDPQIIAAAPTSIGHPSSGSPAAVIVGVVVIAALALAAALVARRRRRTG